MKEMALNNTAANHVYEENIDTCERVMLPFLCSTGVVPAVGILEHFLLICEVAPTRPSQTRICCGCTQLTMYGST